MEEKFYTLLYSSGITTERLAELLKGGLDINHTRYNRSIFLEVVRYTLRERRHEVDRVLAARLELMRMAPHVNVEIFHCERVLRLVAMECRPASLKLLIDAGASPSEKLYNEVFSEANDRGGWSATVELLDYAVNNHPDVKAAE